MQIDDGDEDALAGFAGLVAGGFTAEAAYNQLTRVYRMPQDLALAIWSEFERRAGLIRVATDPAALVEPSSLGAAWYTGPESQDRLWPALKGRLASSMDPDALNSVDGASTKVLSLLHSPGTESFGTRGLVIGNVQSGKTTSFMSVVAKAADRGYRVFIVLSGITNNLRDQTQERIDEMLIGENSSDWYRLTTDSQDFNADPINAATLLGNPLLRFVAVVKKNPGRLTALRDFLKAAGGSVMHSTPVLVIDDEADQASIDIGRGRTSRINGLLREILDNPRTGYLAYTATPFANLLIDPAASKDLYPRNFILALPQSEAYFGGERIFGRSERLTEDDELSDGLDIVRTIPDSEASAIRPPRDLAVRPWTPAVGPALENSIRWFLLSTAAKRLRRVSNPHATMLVHTSMLAQAHEDVAEAVSEFLDEVRAKIELGDPTENSVFRELYESEIRRIVSSDFGLVPVEADLVLAYLRVVLRDVKVIVDNYRSPDRLVYKKGTPTTAIVVGGNTLSRGLTLEGLSSSYFVRAASTYDTLLQMGRWFGYRIGYEDLCRIWMTDGLASWFRDLSLVESEMRQEIRRFEFEQVTPAQVGVRIRRHPSMAITSSVRMRNAVRAQTSYSTARPQTIHFRRKDGSWLRRNIEAVRDLALASKAAGAKEVSFGSGRRGFRDVEASVILRFLDTYRFHERSSTANAAHLREYILKERAAGGLKKWNVVVIAKPAGPREDSENVIDLGMSVGFQKLNRARLGIEGDDSDVAYLKAIVTTRERIADLGRTYEEISSELADSGQTPDDRTLLSYRERQPEGSNGLLCIYPISGASTAKSTQVPETNGLRRVDMSAADDIVGVAFFFPHAKGTDSLVEYVVANIVEQVEESIDDEIDQIEAADIYDEEIAKLEKPLGVEL